MEHVGSTSVEGLAAKPIIDADIVIDDMGVLDEIRHRLEEAGYEYLGERGISERFAFRCKQPEFAHNLYVCVDGCLALRNHLSFRDHLRSHADDRRRYGELKRSLARRYPDDIDAYVRGKTAFITDILRNYGVGEEQLDIIEGQN